MSMQNVLLARVQVMRVEPLMIIAIISHVFGLKMGQGWLESLWADIRIIERAWVHFRVPCTWDAFWRSACVLTTPIKRISCRCCCREWVGSLMFEYLTLTWLDHLECVSVAALESSCRWRILGITASRSQSIKIDTLDVRSGRPVDALKAAVLRRWEHLRDANGLLTQLRDGGFALKQLRDAHDPLCRWGSLLCDWLLGQEEAALLVAHHDLVVAADRLELFAKLNLRLHMRLLLSLFQLLLLHLLLLLTPQDALLTEKVVLLVGQEVVRWVIGDHFV